MGFFDFFGSMRGMKYRTEWNLKLLYKNEKDSQIEKDMRAIEKACADFEKKYKYKDFVSSTSKLLPALKAYEIFLSQSTYKPLWYFRLLKDIKTNDKYTVAMEAHMNERQRKAVNKVLFFELALSKISKKDQQYYLKDKKLEHFWYYLQKIFTRAKHNLSEKEEQLFSLLSQPSEKMWYDAQTKLLSEQIVEYKGKNISLSEASEIYTSLKEKNERHALYQKILAARKSTAHMAESEINAIYTTKKISDELRGYKSPYSETVLQYENNEKEIIDFVDTTTKLFSISRRFYVLHKKLINETNLTVADLYVNIGEIKKRFDFDTAVDIVKKAFVKFDQKYVDLLDSYLKNGQIDVYPRSNKRGGGYCSGIGTLPVFVFLNHVDNLKSVETLAHEMGHAIHTELSKPLDPLYSDYTISVAEVASTFFEQFVADHVADGLSDDEKIILLHDRVNRDITTVFRQIACFNCELELHRQIRSKGYLSKEEMARIMQKHLKSYMGNAVDVTENDGYVFTSWSHLRYSFYVYTYGYGLIISRALYETWKKDHVFKVKIEQFLSAGNSMSPKDIFKSIGIKTDKAFFEAGLKAIEADIDRLEKLAKKQKLIK